jgi:hypothetical protein
MLSMVEAFNRYCLLYVPNVGDLDLTAFAQLKGAFTAGMSLGMTAAKGCPAGAMAQIEEWQAEIDAFWKERRG